MHSNERPLHGKNMQIHFVIMRKIEDRRAADTGGAQRRGHMQGVGLGGRVCVHVGERVLGGCQEVLKLG